MSKPFAHHVMSLQTVSELIRNHLQRQPCVVMRGRKRFRTLESWPSAKTGRLLSFWRRSGGVNLADFPVLAELPIWRQLGANLAGPI